MTYTVLEQFLAYTLQNNIHLTLMDKRFLLNTPDDIELEDLISWLNSDIRKSDKALDIFSEVEICKEQFRSLLTLKSSDMREILNCSENINKSDLAFELIAIAILKKTAKKDRTMLSKDKRQMNIQLVKDLVKSTYRDERLEALSSLPVYNNHALRERILNDNSISETQFLSINQMLRYYRNISSDIVGRYVEFILEDNDFFLEKHSVAPAAQVESIKRLETMARAKEAILSQDDYAKANQVIHAALVRGIYQDKEIFKIIKELPTPLQMANVIYLCQYNRFRKDINLVNDFSQLDVISQKEFLAKIRNDEKSVIDERRRRAAIQENRKFAGLNKALMTFFTEEGALTDIRAFRALSETPEKKNLSTRRLVKKKNQS